MAVIEVPQKLRVVKSIREHVHNMVRIEGEIRKRFLLEKVMKQEDSLSLLLYYCYELQYQTMQENNYRMGNWNLQPIYLQSLD